MQRYTFLSVPIDPQLKREAAIQAAKMDISRSEFCRRAIQDYLKRVEAKENINGRKN